MICILCILKMLSAFMASSNIQGWRELKVIGLIYNLLPSSSILQILKSLLRTFFTWLVPMWEKKEQFLFLHRAKETLSRAALNLSSNFPQIIRTRDCLCSSRGGQIAVCSHWLICVRSPHFLFFLHFYFVQSDHLASLAQSPTLEDGQSLTDLKSLTWSYMTWSLS